MHFFLILIFLLSTTLHSEEIPKQVFESKFENTSYHIFMKALSDPLFKVDISAETTEKEVKFSILSTTVQDKSMKVKSELRTVKTKNFPPLSFNQKITNFEENGQVRVRIIDAKFKEKKAKYSVIKDGKETTVQAPWDSPTIDIYQLLLLMPKLNNLGPKTKLKFAYGSYDNAENGKEVLMTFVQNEEIDFYGKKLKAQIFSLNETASGKKVFKLWIWKGKVLIAEEKHGSYKILPELIDKK